eukprot:14514444-Alexandrium_andersonii.AAC.1
MCIRDSTPHPQRRGQEAEAVAAQRRLAQAVDDRASSRSCMCPAAFSECEAQTTRPPRNSKRTPV